MAGDVSGREGQVWRTEVPPPVGSGSKYSEAVGICNNMPLLCVCCASFAGRMAKSPAFIRSYHAGESVVV